MCNRRDYVSISKDVFLAKPIDMLAKYINSSDSDVELQEPYQLLRVCVYCYSDRDRYYDCYYRDSTGAIWRIC